MKRQRRNNKAGFTLAEILAAMVFMAIVIPITLHGILIANHASLAAERKLNAAYLGENLLQEMIITETWLSSARQGDFGDQWPGYSWQLVQEDWVEDEMQLLTMVVTYTVQQKGYEIRVSTLIDDTEYDEEQAETS